MKKYLVTFTLALSALGSIAQAEEPKFLGTYQLQITEQVWEPRENHVPVGDITHDVAYSDYRVQPEAELKFTVRSGLTYGFGCETSDVVQRYFLLELNEAGEVVAEAEIGAGGAELKAGRPYLVRVRLANLKACDGFGTTLLALRK